MLEWTHELFKVFTTCLVAVFTGVDFSNYSAIDSACPWDCSLCSSLIIHRFWTNCSLRFWVDWRALKESRDTYTVEPFKKRLERFHQRKNLPKGKRQWCSQYHQVLITTATGIKSLSESRYWEFSNLSIGLTLTTHPIKIPYNFHNAIKRGDLFGRNASSSFVIWMHKCSHPVFVTACENG